MSTSPADKQLTTPTRDYWQWPTFLGGVTALIAAIQFVPKPVDRPTPERARAELAAVLDRKPIQAAAVEPLVSELENSQDTSPASLFQLGSAYVALAELAPTDSEQYWKSAAQAFSKCDKSGLDSPSDQTLFDFRSAKAAAAIGTGDPIQLIRTLTAIPNIEDKTECPRLIADTALRLNPPDKLQAMTQLSAYLAGPNKASPGAVAKYKFTLAKLYAESNQAEQARVWLKDVTTTGPAEVAASANSLLGRLYMLDNKDAEAIKAFEAAQSVTLLPAEERQAIRYQIGLAHQKLGQLDKAAEYLNETVNSSGPMASAAAARLASLRSRELLATGDRKQMAELLEKAVVPAGGLAPADQASLRTTFEQMIETCRAEKDYANGVRVATAYAPLAENAKDRKTRAEFNTAWANELLKSGKSAEAKAKFVSAADDYAKLAEQSTEPTDRSDFLRSAAKSYRDGGDVNQASLIVDQMLLAPELPNDVRGQAWLDRAQLLPPERTDEVTEALQKAMAIPCPAATEARYRLGMLHLASTGPDAKAKQTLGRDFLKQIALASTITPAEHAIHEMAQFELGKIALERDNDPTEAERWFRKLLTLYPSGTTADQSRLWLSGALLKRAPNSPTPNAVRTEALQILKDLSRSKSEFLRNWSEIWQANTLLQLGDAAATITLTKELIAKHKGKLEELIISKILLFAQLDLRPTPDTAQAQLTYARMVELYRTLPREAYLGSGEYSFDFWTEELPKLKQKIQ